MAVDNKRLDELMLEKHPYITYDADTRTEFLESYKGNLEDEDKVVWLFVDYLMSQGLAEIVE